MRYLVTGASGFVGAHLVRFLVKHDCQVAVLVRSTSNLWRLQDVLGDITIIEGDLFELTRSVPHIREFVPEVVVHLGWSAVIGKHRDDFSQIQNLWGSLNLIHVTHQIGCRSWIGLGSQAEYGRHDHAITEDTPTQPTSLYGIIKLGVALLGQKLCGLYGIRFLWLRLFSTYGPMDHPEFLIPYTICTLLRKRRPSLTLGEQRWDYLYIEDAVQCIWQLATSKSEGIFNLGSGQVQTIRTIVEQVRDLIDPHQPLGFGEVKYSSNQIMHLQADISRLQQTIGWSPQTHLIDGLTRTINWYRQNIDLYER